MTWIEALFILMGISMEIFAQMACKGAVVKQVKKTNLLAIFLILCAGQLIAFLFGFFLSDIYSRKNPGTPGPMLGEILAAAIFFLLGIRLMVKAVRNDWIEERLQNKFHALEYVRIVFYTAFYNLMAGLAAGFLNADVLILTLLIILLTAAVVILGMYTGYRLGFEQKTKAYIAGALLLWIACGDVVIRHIFEIF